MKVPVMDLGGTYVKLHATGQQERRRFESGPDRTSQRIVPACVERLVPALQLDDVVLGGGKARQLDELPKGCRAGDNTHAFLGGFRPWAKLVVSNSVSTSLNDER